MAKKKNGKNGKNGKNSKIVLDLTPEEVLGEREKWKEIGDSVHRQLVVENLTYILKEMKKKRQKKGIANEGGAKRRM